MGDIINIDFKLLRDNKFKRKSGRKSKLDKQNEQIQHFTFTIEYDEDKYHWNIIPETLLLTENSKRQILELWCEWLADFLEGDPSLQEPFRELMLKALHLSEREVIKDEDEY